LHDPVEPLEFLPKILIQTAQVTELLGGAKILPKSLTLWAGRTNVTDDRQQTDRQRNERNAPKNRDFLPLSRFISEMIQDRAMVTTEHQ